MGNMILGGNDIIEFLGDCQKFAVEIGTEIGQEEGKGTTTVAYLEEDIAEQQVLVFSHVRLLCGILWRLKIK